MIITQSVFPPILQLLKRLYSNRLTVGSFMSDSSDEEYGHKQTGKNYTIDLNAFHRSKLRLEAELRNKSSCNDIIDAYCGDKTPYKDINPLISGDGIFPLITEIYKHSASEGTISTCWGKPCLHTETGVKLINDINGEGADVVRQTTYGETGGISLATPTQMHYHPAKAWRMIDTYIKMRGGAEAIGIESDTWNTIRRKTKRWLRDSHRLFSILISRLPTDGVHLAEGMEMSHGPQFYNMLQTRFGHTHAQCLATLLQIITTLQPSNPDPRTGKKETIMDYFDRAQRIAREAKAFPVMRVPIPDPLLKVMLLQGLMRSDESKYKHMVLREYAKNLESTFDELRQTMQTVEGLREQEIINEYAPTAALAQADVMTIEGRKPNDPCYFPGHKGHCNKECMKQHPELRPKRQTKSTNLCRFWNANGSCPYGNKCKFKHRNEAVASALYKANKPKHAYVTDATDDESSSESHFQ